MKRIVLSTITATFGLGAAFAHDVESDGIKYNIIDGPALEVTSMRPIEFPHQKPEESYSGNIVIPDEVYVNGYGNLSVVSIDEEAFSHSDVPSVTLPSSIIQMGARAFYCSSIQTIDLSETRLSEIPMEAFDGCENLGSVSLPEGLKSIGIMAFSSTALKTLRLPDSVEIIESTAFAATPIERLDMNNSLRWIGDQAFSSTSLKTVSWSENLSIISWGAFECSELTEVILPATITKICGMAFGKIDSLARVICLANNPSDISIHEWTFFNTDLSSCTLEVPAESLPLYENAPVWREFGKIIPHSKTSINQPEISEKICVRVCDGGMELPMGHNGRLSISDISGRIIYSDNHATESRMVIPLPAGVYIVRDGCHTVKCRVN